MGAELIGSFVGYLGGWLLSGIIGYFLGKPKGRGDLGGMLGLLLGPLGWLIVMCLNDVGFKCPHCGGGMPAGNFTRCRHCGQELPQQIRPPGKRRKR